MLNTDNYYGAVYETTNLINGKKYIGKLVFSRKNDWSKYLGSGLYLQRAIRKYGKENFTKEILFLALDNDELNELEEIVIELSNAVESENYYNIKYTSIGGDVFTNNPNKEDIRQMRINQMSGNGNHQYGKEKTDKMITAVKEANSKKIIVDDTLYESITECSKQINENITTISMRLNSLFNRTYFYADEYGNKIPKDIPQKPNRGCKSNISVLAYGIIYQSIRSASRELGMPISRINKLIDNGEISILRESEII
jgi:group I intron endonuclease